MDFATLDMLQDLYNKELISQDEYLRASAKTVRHSLEQEDLYGNSLAYQYWKTLEKVTEWDQLK